MIGLQSPEHAGQGEHKERESIYVRETREFFQFPSPNSYIQSSGWKECKWVATLQEATKLPYDSAIQLIEELKARSPGHQHVAERDEHSEANVPPYGLDNFVVRRTA